jgi:tetratricopeptide (TPR) repeat protein
MSISGIRTRIGRRQFIIRSVFVCILGLVFTAVLLSQANDVPRGAFETVSRLGRKLYALPDDPAILEARQALSADPKNPDKFVRLSKAQAGRRQYREAVETCTQGLQVAPNSADLYLERGHRELGLREFEKARTDLQDAVRLSPEMLDAHYHLGLAHYFLRQFDQAAASFEKARALAKSDDSLIDCSNWLYVSLRRAGREKDASSVLLRITPQVNNTEPHLFFYLRLLHFYQGQLTEQAVLPPPPSGPQDLEGELAYDTVNYGVGNWHLYHHQPAEARALFNKVVTGEAWNAWGFIGSELELAGDKAK